jgi:hypothetical protein
MIDTHISYSGGSGFYRVMSSKIIARDNSCSVNLFLDPPSPQPNAWFHLAGVEIKYKAQSFEKSKSSRRRFH